MTEPKGEGGLQAEESCDTVAFPTLSSMPGFLQAEGGSLGRLSNLKRPPGSSALGLVFCPCGV